MIDINKISFINFPQEYQNLIAICDGNRRSTYSQISKMITEIALKLQQIPLQNGDKIAILAENSIEYSLLILAALQTGIIAIPMNTRWPLKEIDNYLCEIDCRHIFVSQTYQDFAACSLIQMHSLPDFCAIPKHNEFPEKQKFLPEFVNPNEPATVIFTSGSLAEPKGVLHTLANHIYNAHGANQNMPLQTGDRWLQSLPAFHVGGLAIMFRTLLAGATFCIPAAQQNMFDAIQQFQPTHLSLVYTQLFRILKREQGRELLKNCRAILLGGSSFPQKIIQECIDLELPIHRSYGSTEMGSQVTTTQVGADEQSLFTSGKLLNYREIKIVADGEIWLRGKTLFSGYLRKDGLDTSVFENGWFPTGDLGEWTENGNLLITGRKDDMFISGGENIHPREIETALCKMESVYNAMVVAIDHPEFGQRPVAFIRMQPGFALNAAVLGNQLKRVLPKYKIPNYFFTMPPDIENETFKLRRTYFRNLAEEKIKNLKK